jgi:hypothetical protein
MHPTTIPAPGETLVTGAWFRAYFKAVVRLTHKVSKYQPMPPWDADYEIHVGSAGGRITVEGVRSSRTFGNAHAAALFPEGDV